MRMALVFAAALALAGCGGGGGNPGTCHGSSPVCGGVDPSPGPDRDSPTGLFKGSTGTGRTAYTLVLENREFWLLYGRAGSADRLGGFERGTYSARDGEITVPDLVDFSAATGLAATGSMTGTYVTETRIAGTVRFGPEVGSFAGAYDPDSTEQAVLADAVGTYSGGLSVTDGSDAADLSVSATGTVIGTSASGCRISGTLLPIAKANAFSLNVELAGGVCGNEITAVRGVAILEGTRIFSAGLDGLRTEGFVFSGGR